jgi:hypothetical protein
MPVQVPGAKSQIPNNLALGVWDLRLDYVGNITFDYPSQLFPMPGASPKQRTLLLVILPGVLLINLTKYRKERSRDSRVPAH